MAISEASDEATLTSSRLREKKVHAVSQSVKREKEEEEETERGS